MTDFLKTCRIPMKLAAAAGMIILGVLMFPEITLIILVGVFLGQAWQHMPEYPVSHYIDKLLK